MLSKVILLYLLFLCARRTNAELQLQRKAECNDVCRDLPPGDAQPVCMMISRYKKAYLYFANQCQARRAICSENYVLSMVHWVRCHRSMLHFMPIP